MSDRWVSNPARKAGEMFGLSRLTRSPPKSPVPISINAQNIFIYSMCRLLLKHNCSNVFNTLFIKKAVVNLARTALETYRYNSKYCCVIDILTSYGKSVMANQLRHATCWNIPCITQFSLFCWKSLVFSILFDESIDVHHMNWSGNSYQIKYLTVFSQRFKISMSSTSRQHLYRSFSDSSHLSPIILTAVGASLVPIPVFFHVVFLFIFCLSLFSAELSLTEDLEVWPNHLSFASSS